MVRRQPETARSDERLITAGTAASLCAANAHDARGRRRAEIDTAGASRLAEVCKHQTSGYSDRRFAADIGRTAIKPSLLRHSRATVDPDRGRLSAPQQRFTINREPLDLQGIRPDSLLRSWLRIPVAVLAFSLQISHFW